MQQDKSTNRVSSEPHADSRSRTIPHAARLIPSFDFLAPVPRRPPPTMQTRDLPGMLQTLSWLLNSRCTRGCDALFQGLNSSWGLDGPIGRGLVPILDDGGGRATPSHGDGAFKVLGK